MLVLAMRWALSVVAAALTYGVILVVGVFLFARLHLVHFQVGWILLFGACGFAAVRAAAICMPARLRFAAMAPVGAALTIFAIINLFSGAKLNKTAFIDIDLMVGTMYGAFLPVLSHLVYQMQRRRKMQPEIRYGKSQQ